ncbi:MAG: phosphoribosylformylglycinamidine cyclo-ligase [Spirochaetia bacterium]
MEYKEAGVDRDSGYEIVERIGRDMEATRNENVLGKQGGFGSLYRLGDYRDPVLVSGTDGVGTKLHIAVEYDKLEGVGIDCVAMCVNDILCHGATPLFFLDYLAYAELAPGQAARVVHGVSEGCLAAGCALVGGETAQMPGTYRPGDLDIAGFAVGAAERESLIDGRRIREGDRLVGLDSSGVHSNGFSLVRALVHENGMDLTREYEIFRGDPLWKVLLEPTQIYVKAVLPLLETGAVHGMAHITGGGLYENVPRMFPKEEKGEELEELTAVIEEGALNILPVFSFIESLGVERSEMFHTFNMGAGFVLAVDPEMVEMVIEGAAARGISSRPIGRIERGSDNICIGRSGKVCIE